jgi:hypothetical protein
MKLETSDPDPFTRVDAVADAAKYASIAAAALTITVLFAEAEYAAFSELAATETRTVRIAFAVNEAMKDSVV